MTRDELRPGMPIEVRTSSGLIDPCPSVVVDVDPWAVAEGSSPMRLAGRYERVALGDGVAVATWAARSPGSPPSEWYPAVVPLDRLEPAGTAEAEAAAYYLARREASHDERGDAS